jgi:hypothetical protein
MRNGQVFKSNTKEPYSSIGESEHKNSIKEKRKSITDFCTNCGHNTRLQL